MVAAVDITESLRVAGGEFAGGDLGFDDAEVATAKATAAVDVLLLYHNDYLEIQASDDFVLVELSSHRGHFDRYSISSEIDVRW